MTSLRREYKRFRARKQCRNGERIEARLTRYDAFKMARYVMSKEESKNADSAN